MRTTTLLTALCLAAVSVRAADPALGITPGERKSVMVSGEERNPFGRRASKGPGAPVDAASEESRIRVVLEGLPVGGITTGSGGVKVLLGSLLLRKGAEVPPVIPNQTEKIRVLSLSGGQIELGFIEKDGTAETRRIQLPMNLAPDVRFSLANKSPKKPESNETLGGVKRKDASAAP